MDKDFTIHPAYSLQFKALLNVVQMFSGVVNWTEINP